MDNTFGFFLVAITVCSVVGMVIHQINLSNVTKPGQDLHQKFVDLGDLSRQSKADILNAVGNPTSISSVGAGQELYQWQATGCHMALLFEGNKCKGITHQYLS